MVVLPSAIGPVFFGLPTGLWAVLGVLPLLLLYLIRPRPKVMEIPSLMFFMRAGGKSVVSSFLRTILRDLLLLLQLVIALALLLVPSQPYTNTQFDLAAEHTVLVIDTSASSQVIEDGETRLERSLDLARDLLGKKTTIVVAKGTPEILIQGASAVLARKHLSDIKATDTSSHIGEAMLLAGQALGEDGRIVVLSDFDNTQGVAPEIAKTALEARGIPVAFVSTAQGTTDNVGFIDFLVGEDTSTTYIRNFAAQERTVTLRIGAVARQLTIPAGGLEPFQFKTPAGVNEMVLETGDAFAADDTITISAPEESAIRVLLITNTKSNFLESALTSSPRIDLAISEPPIISKAEYDVYVLHNLRKSEVLPGTYEELLDRVRKGAGLVIVSQDGLGGFEFGNLLPVHIEGDGADSYINVLQETAITRNLEFGSVTKHIKAKPRQGAVSLLSASENTSILTIKAEGAGATVYFGIIEDASEFRLTPDYPIFWQNLLRVLAQRADVRELNRKAGDTISVGADSTVKDPNGNYLQGPLVTFEHRGLYTVGDRTVAVNHLNAQESELRYHANIDSSADANKIATVKEERQFYWEMMLIIIAFVFLFLELIFLKVRGDI